MYNYRLGLLMLVAVFMISPAVMDWWLDDTGAWYKPFAIWLLLIALYIGINHKGRKDEL